MEILVNKDGQQYGPYELNDLSEYVSQGSFALTDLCWQDGWADWQPLSSIISIPPPPAAPVQGVGVGRDSPPPLPEIPAPVPKQYPISTFTIIASLGFVICLFTPRLIVALPIFGTVICAVIAIFRKERARVFSAIVLALTIGLLFFSSSGISSSGSSSNLASLSSVKVEDWNWKKDPSFGTEGTIRWSVKIKNLSEKYVESVKVELTTYDQSGKLITTAFTFVSSIPPGDTRSKQGFANYYGTEQKASLKVVNVRFAR
jgi:hypothetical protein